MNSSGTDANGLGEPEIKEPKIDAVCLIPEPRTLTHMLDPDRAGVELKLEQFMLMFARRFTYPYYLTIRNGLVGIGERWKPSDKSYGDLKPEDRHIYLNAIRGQLNLLVAYGRPCVCMAGGLITQGLRKLDLDFVMPLAAMSQRQRREWLKARNKEGVTVVLSKLWGTTTLPSFLTYDDDALNLSKSPAGE